MRIARPFTTIGEALTCERHTRSTTLSQATGCERLGAEALTFHSPSLCPARLWKRFAECFANSPPWVRARGAHCKTVCTRSVSYPSALPLARSRRGALANGQSSPCLRAVRTQFCSARLVRAPPEGKCFAQIKALPKTRRPQDRAEKGLRESPSLSPPKATRSLVKGTREAPPFHKPLDAKGLVRKRSPFTGHCAAAGRGKNSAKHDPFTYRTPTTRVFAERLAMCASIYPASGARTGRALQNGLHAEREQAIGSAIG